MDALSAEAQLDLLDAFVHDETGRIPTGFRGMDSLLRKGGFAPGEHIMLAGRTQTRKSTVVMNLVIQMLRSGVSVGLVGLDESKESYIAKTISAMSGLDGEEIETEWDGPLMREVRDEYLSVAERLALYAGKYRPKTNDLTAWLADLEVTAERPQVVFIDYVSLLFRNSYDGGENQRVPRLVEELQVWTKEQEIVTVSLHQVGKTAEGSSLHYHGDTPMTLERLKYGVEEIPDIVLGTYRPARNPDGNLPYELACLKNDKLTEDKWYEMKKMVEKYQDTTFLQLLKNRPGTRVDTVGIQLRSVGASMQMVEEERDAGDWLRAYGE